MRIICNSKAEKVQVKDKISPDDWICLTLTDASYARILNVIVVIIFYIIYCKDVNHQKPLKNI